MGAIRYRGGMETMTYRCGKHNYSVQIVRNPVTYEVYRVCLVLGKEVQDIMPLLSRERLSDIAAQLEALSEAPVMRLRQPGQDTMRPVREA